MKASATAVISGVFPNMLSWFLVVDLGFLHFLSAFCFAFPCYADEAPGRQRLRTFVVLCVCRIYMCRAAWGPHEKIVLFSLSGLMGEIASDVFLPPTSSDRKSLFASLTPFAACIPFPARRLLFVSPAFAAAPSTPLWRASSVRPSDSIYLST